LLTLFDHGSAATVAKNASWQNRHAAHPAQRAAFEQAVIAELQKLPPETRGPGTLHRVIATCQRTYLGSGTIAVGPGNLSAYGKAALRDKGK